MSALMIGRLFLSNNTVTCLRGSCRESLPEGVDEQDKIH